MSTKKTIPAVEWVRNRINLYKGMPWKNRKDPFLKAMNSDNAFEVAAVTFEDGGTLFAYAVTRMFFYGKPQEARTFLIEKMMCDKENYEANLRIGYKIAMPLLYATTALESERIDSLYYLSRHTRILRYKKFESTLYALLTEAGKHAWAKDVEKIAASYAKKNLSI